MDIDWKHWVERWDRMQDYYVAGRSERFRTICELISVTQTIPEIIVDIGCGPGTLSLHLLENYPETILYGIDIDPTLLPLAKARTAQFGDRIKFVHADIRLPSWTNSLPHDCNAIVSATALHWLKIEHLKSLYKKACSLLRPGGIFLNADHVGSPDHLIQRAWESHREEMRKNISPGRDAWDKFWDEYLGALGNNAREERAHALGKWEGIEEGMPLSWHFDRLRECGFYAVDCFWRCDCDAIYGGIKEQ